MDLSKFESQIAKTGFVLENRIAQELKNSGWTVISNRYYVDDHEETVREIDVVAYRTTKIQHFRVYTSLIISCKKSEANVWGLLSRDMDLKDPNADWWPLHVWTNDKALLHQISQVNAAKAHHHDANALGVVDALRVPSVEVFAFQEMDRTTGAPKNDTPIYNSITSLMKAQAYEESALPTRRKDPAVYQFNLIAVADTDLVRLHFTTSGIQSESLDHEHYIARYIIRKKQTVARIRFVKADKFSGLISDYDRLHAANVKIFSTQCDEFYRDILKDYIRVGLLIEDFRRMTCSRLYWGLKERFGDSIDVKDLYVSWDSDKKMASIVSLTFDPPVCEYLSSNPERFDVVRKALKEIYRYEGPYCFNLDIPF